MIPFLLYILLTVVELLLAIRYHRKGDRFGAGYFTALVVTNIVTIIVGGIC